ncbi:hypothetical protein ACOSP6_12110 [Tenacibaculum sp. MEBiC06402]|uniref:hypothetical protein n=1 Tax=Tenacibaculum sp. MEBiC06402 TaxID=3412023 RepID=UPI003B9B3188
MIKYIKYLLSLILVFGQAGGEYSIYSELSPTSCYQILFNSRKSSSTKTSFSYSIEVAKTNTQTLLLKDFSFVSNEFSKRYRVLIKLYLEYFESYKNIFSQLHFLNTKITTSNLV